MSQNKKICDCQVLAVVSLLIARREGGHGVLTKIKASYDKKIQDAKRKKDVAAKEQAELSRLARKYGFKCQKRPTYRW